MLFEAVGMEKARFTATGMSLVSLSTNSSWSAHPVKTANITIIAMNTSFFISYI